MKYFQPKSLTWWSGVLSVTLGVLMMVMPENLALPELAAVLNAFMGGAGAAPANMIVLGLGLIGVRAKLEDM